MHDPTLSAAEARDFARAVAAGRPHRPLYIKLKLVWTCNLRCAMCRHWRDEEEAPLPLEAFLPVVDELATLGCRKLHLSGGEPTLRRDLETLIARAYRQGIRVTMTTNGTALTEARVASLVAAGLRRANISLDSPDPAIHEAVRGVPGCWARTVAGIRRLSAALPPGKVRVNTVVTPLNYSSLGPMASVVHALGAGALNLIPVDPHQSDLGALSGEEIRDYNARIAPQLAREGRRLGVLRHSRDAYPFGRSDALVDHDSRGDYARGYYDHHRCYAPWTHALIDHAGRVSVCCMTPRRPVVGDLRRESFTAIWRGEAFAALRRRERLPLLPACRQCDMFTHHNRRLETLAQGNPWLNRWRELRHRHRR